MHSPVAETSIPWTDLSSGEHIAHFYDDDSALLDTLTGFLRGGLSSGESAIVIATPEHLRSVYHRLPEVGVQMQRILLEDRFIALDAKMALSSFMVNNWPDETLFRCFVDTLIRRAACDGRKVRVFGEMVAVLWSGGHYAATVRLEQMWSRFCQSHSFAVLCSYPKAQFMNDPMHSLAGICAAHSKVV